MVGLVEDEYKGVPHVMVSREVFSRNLRIVIIDPDHPEPGGGYLSKAVAIISPEEARDLMRWIAMFVPPK